MYAEILHLKYDNGEMDQLPARRVEPEEYLPPSIGSRVCCKVKGAKYSAEIVAIEITTPTKNMPPASNKVQTLLYTDSIFYGYIIIIN